MREERYPGAVCRLYDGSLPFYITLAGSTGAAVGYQRYYPHSVSSRLEYALSGEGHVNIDGVLFHPKPGDAWLLQEGRDHFYAADSEKPWERIWVNFRGPLAEQYLRSLKLERTNHFPGLDIRGELEETVSLIRTGREEDAREAMFSVMRILWSMQETLGGKQNGEKQRIRTLTDFIDSHAGEDISLERLATAVDLSVSQTIRIFRRQLGLSPYQYVLGAKISLAKRLLLETELTLPEIADSLGYSDEYNFSRAFRSKTGFTPAAFRRSYS